MRNNRCLREATITHTARAEEGRGPDKVSKGEQLCSDASDADEDIHHGAGRQCACWPKPGSHPLEQCRLWNPSIATRLASCGLPHDCEGSKAIQACRTGSRDTAGWITVASSPLVWLCRQHKHKRLMPLKNSHTQAEPQHPNCTILCIMNLQY